MSSPNAPGVAWPNDPGLDGGGSGGIAIGDSVSGSAGSRLLVTNSSRDLEDGPLTASIVNATELSTWTISVLQYGPLGLVAVNGSYATLAAATQRVGDGSGTLLSAVYPTLGAAQAVYPFATALTQTVDYCALEAACLEAASLTTSTFARGETVDCPAGNYITNTTWDLFVGVNIHGHGMTSTMFQQVGTGPVFQAPVTTLAYAGVNNALIRGRGITVASASGNYTEGSQNDGIYLPMGNGNSPSQLSCCTNCLFENLLVENCGNQGMHIEGGDTIFQNQQFNTFRNILVVGSGVSNWYRYGFVQNNTFDRCDGNESGSHSWQDRAFLNVGTGGWSFPQDNTHIRCLAQGSGTLNGTTGTTTTHGHYCEGARNSWQDCYFEGNGLGDTAGASAGAYFQFVPTGKANNVMKGCHFDNHFFDWWSHAGDANIIDESNFSWDGAHPAAKTSFLRVETQSASNRSYIGLNTYSGAAPVMFVASGTVAPAYINQPVGLWQPITVFTNGWSSVGPPYAAVSWRILPDQQHVELAGQITGGTAAAAFTLPAATASLPSARPVTTKILTAMANFSGGAGRQLQIASTGVVTPLNTAGGPFSLDGIIFPLDI